MQHELQELQPVLAATAKEVEDMMLVIAHDKEEAAETKKMVQQQEREANEQAAAAKAIAGGSRPVYVRLLPLQHAVCTLIAGAHTCCASCMKQHTLLCCGMFAHITLLCRVVPLYPIPADDAQRDLDAALPALDAAVASLKNLSRNDVVEVRSLQNPPAGVKLVMEATCIMFDEKPKMKDDPNKMGE
jgi:hypothetical protein